MMYLFLSRWQIDHSRKCGAAAEIIEGQQVQFDVVKGPKGWQAENMKGA
jgi:cold shock CspA family protein